jgi:hypothetical protein
LIIVAYQPYQPQLNEHTISPHAPALHQHKQGTPYHGTKTNALDAERQTRRQCTDACINVDPTMRVPREISM